MTTERLWFTIGIIFWIVGWYQAQREIGRLQNKVDMYNERAYVLQEFIKEFIPSEVEHSKQVLAEKTKWRSS